MLARLCLEEQLVDQDESTGSKGKYGSKYHPRESLGGGGGKAPRGRGTRPLTRGELTANWPDMADVLTSNWGLTHEREEEIR